MTSEAQKRAAAKYAKKNVRRVTIAFSPVDTDIVAHLEKQESMSGYIKRLVREDMERTGDIPFV